MVCHILEVYHEQNLKDLEDITFCDGIFKLHSQPQSNNLNQQEINEKSLSVTSLQSSVSSEYLKIEDPIQYTLKDLADQNKSLNNNKQINDASCKQTADIPFDIVDEFKCEATVYDCQTSTSKTFFIQTN